MPSVRDVVGAGATVILLVASALPGHAQPVSAQPAGAMAFSDQSIAAGLGARHPGAVSAPPTAPGGAVGDFDGDGWPDVFYATGGGAPDRLFQNRGDGTFVDVAAPAGVAAVHRAQGAAAADVNGDGALDLFIPTLRTGDPALPPYGRLMLYLNRGDGSFSCCARYLDPDRRLASNVGGIAPAFGDYDLDGDLDLFVAGWEPGGTGNVLFRNDGTEVPGAEGAVTFVEVARAAGIAEDDVLAFASRFVDLNGDFYPELLVAGDFGSSRYYRNNGDGTFRDATRNAGAGREANGMGLAVSDLDGDGMQDWYVTSVYTRAPLHRTPGTGNTLYLSSGPDRFRESASVAGVLQGGWGWGVAAADLDHDGRIDLVTTTGWGEPNGAGVMEWDGQPTFLFRNLGNEEGVPLFVEVADAAGLRHTRQGRGLVHLDYDRDGDQDILIFNHGDGPSLFRNDRTVGHWLRISLDTSATPALAPHGWGARVRVTTGLGLQVRVVGTGGYFATSELTLHFGLGDWAGPASVEVAWPDGTATELSAVDVDQALAILAPAPGPPAGR